jgi:hypothetical protein
MANENIGEIAWGCCDAVVKFVRMDKKEKLYIACPNCGNSAAKGKSFQETIKGKAVMYGTPTEDYAGGGKPAGKEPEAIPEEKAAVVIEEKEAIPPKKPKRLSELVGGVMNVFGREE